MSTPTTVGAAMPEIQSPPSALLEQMREEFNKGVAGERLELPPLAPITPDAIAARRRLLVPARFLGIARYHTFVPKTDSQRAALTITERFVAAVRAGQTPMLALIGAQGTGKSHLLYAALHDLLGDDRRAFSRPWYRLADELRYGRGQDEAHQVRSEMWAHRLVMLDEVRPTASTMLDENELAKFACHAYDNAVAVILTTNVSPLAQVMGEAAASRFTQITIDGPDHRQK